MIAPYYQRGPVTLYHGKAENIAPQLHQRGIVFTDTAYSEAVHEKATSAGKRTDPLLDGNGRASPCTRSRKVDLGFGPLTPAFRRFCAEQAARLASRWALFFCDAEGLAGSGTTLVCAAQLGRTAVGIELRESCCEDAARRLEAELSGWGGRVSKKSSQLGFFDLGRTSPAEASAA